MSQLLSQPPDPHNLHVPARCHRCAAVTTPSQTPSPSFLPPEPRNVSSCVVPSCRARWVLGICSPLGGGKEWSREKQEWEIRARDKARPIFILQSNYQSFPILNLPRAPWCDWILPQAWQQFPHHTSPASKPRKLPHLGSHWDTCAAELPARLPLTSSSPWPRNRDGDLAWDPGLQLGGSHCRDSRVGYSLGHLAELLGRFGSQHCEHAKSLFSPSAASQGVLAEISGPQSTLQHPSIPASHGTAGVWGASFPTACRAVLHGSAKSRLAPFPASPCPVTEPGLC